MSSRLAELKCSFTMPKSSRWNERLYCTPIDRVLKIRFNEGCTCYLQPNVTSNGSLSRTDSSIFEQNKYTQVLILAL